MASTGNGQVKLCRDHLEKINSTSTEDDDNSGKIRFLTVEFNPITKGEVVQVLTNPKHPVYTPNTPLINVLVMLTPPTHLATHKVAGSPFDVGFLPKASVYSEVAAAWIPVAAFIKAAIAAGRDAKADPKDILRMPGTLTLGHLIKTFHQDDDAMERADFAEIKINL